jgi:hypothetical protein
MKRPLWTLHGRRLVRRFDGRFTWLAGVASGALGFVFLRVMELDRVGTGLLMVGAVLLLYRRTAVLDAGARTLTSGWGLLVPWRTVVRSVESMDLAELEVETQVFRGRGGVSVYEYYPVTLSGPHGPLRLDRLQGDRQEARRLARQVSRLLAVRYCDRTVDPPLKLLPSQLDESLGQRYLRTGEELAEPQKPGGCRALYRETPEGLEVHIPRAGLASFWGTLGLMAAMAVMAALFGSRGSTFYWSRLGEAGWLVAVVAVVAAYPLWLAWKLDRLVETVRLDRLGLKVASTMEGHLEIPLQELRELVVIDKSSTVDSMKGKPIQPYRAGVLSAGTDLTDICVGRALDHGELNYLHTLLLRRIVAFARQHAGG